SGTIMSFEANGKFVGLLQDPNNNPIAIDGLWALTFGNGNRAGSAQTLFFSAGPAGESQGLFGALNPMSQGDHEDGDQDHDNGNHNGNDGHGDHDGDND